MGGEEGGMDGKWGEGKKGEGTYEEEPLWEEARVLGEVGGYGLEDGGHDGQELVVAMIECCEVDSDEGYCFTQHEMMLS